MARFQIANTISGAADAGEVGLNLWNPHGSIALRVGLVAVETTAALTGGRAVRLVRTTTQGAGAATYTTDADNHFGRRAAPVSGAVLGRGNFTTAPTVSGSPLRTAQVSERTGSAVTWWFPVPIIVPPGTGLGAQFPEASNGFCGTFRWDE